MRIITLRNFTFPRLSLPNLVRLKVPIFPEIGSVGNSPPNGTMQPLSDFLHIIFLYTTKYSKNRWKNLGVLTRAQNPVMKYDKIRFAEALSVPRIDVVIKMSQQRPPFWIWHSRISWPWVKNLHKTHPWLSNYAKIL